MVAGRHDAAENCPTRRTDREIQWRRWSFTLSRARESLELRGTYNEVRPVGVLDAGDESTYEEPAETAYRSADADVVHHCGWRRRRIRAMNRLVLQLRLMRGGWCHDLPVRRRSAG